MAVLLPECCWECVALYLPVSPCLLSLAGVSTDMRGLVYGDLFMVRYWRRVMGVWDVLRYKRIEETWFEFFVRADSEKQEYLERLEGVGRGDGIGTDAISQAVQMSQRGLVRLTFLRDFYGAKEDFLRSIELSQNVLVPSLNNLAVTQLYLGNLISEVKCFQDAETLLRRSLEDPRGKSSVSAGNLCVALIKQGRFEEALEHGRIATKLALNERPVNANAFHHMGFALYCLSLPQLAVEYCSLSVLIKPRYSEAYFTRGLAKKAIGLEEEATQDFEEALLLSRATSVYSYVHMYASTGEPCHEGFAPRQRAPACGLEGLSEELASLMEYVKGNSPSELVGMLHHNPQGQLAGVFQRFLRQDLGALQLDDEDEEGEGEEDEDEDEDEDDDQENDSFEN